MRRATEASEAMHDHQRALLAARRMLSAADPKYERSESISLREARIAGELRRACEDSSVMTLRCDAFFRYSLCLLPHLAIDAFVPEIRTVPVNVKLATITALAVRPVVFHGRKVAVANLATLPSPYESDESKPTSPSAMHAPGRLLPRKWHRNHLLADCRPSMPVRKRSPELKTDD